MSLRRLVLGSPLEGEVNKGAYAVYTVAHPDPKSKLLTIHVAPVDADSDPDLYVSNSSLSTATKEIHTWKSCLVGQDRVDIHPDDPEALSGDYTVGVWGYSPVTKFILTATARSPEPIHKLNTFPACIDSTLTPNTPTHFYHFSVDSSARSSIKIKLDCDSPCVSLFASNSTLYPDQSMNRWKALGHAVLLDDNKTADAQTNINDTDEEKQTHCQIIIDSDEYKYCNADCYIAVKYEKLEKGYKDANIDSATLQRILAIDANDIEAINAALFNLLSDQGQEEAVMHVRKQQERQEAKEQGTENKDNNVAGLKYKLTVECISEEDSLEPNHHIWYQKFKKLFMGIDGSQSSQSERKKKLLDNDKSFTYGEVSFVSFVDIIDKLNQTDELVFYDLGSGTGKGLAAAYFLGAFQQCKGIELLSGLYDMSATMIERFERDHSLWKSISDPPNLDVIQGNFLNIDWWSVADVVYVSSICFEDELYTKLCERFELMKKGAKIVTLKLYTSSNIQLIDRGWYSMSWGKCTVYFLQRV